MPEATDVNNDDSSENSKKSKKLIDILKKFRENHDNYYNNNNNSFHEDFKESELREIFYTLSGDEKMLIIYEAVLSNAVGIADSERKLDFFKQREKISVSTWFKKVLITFFAFTGAFAFSTFVFMMLKNGAFNNISFVSSFFLTMNEVLNVIFLTK